MEYRLILINLLVKLGVAAAIAAGLVRSVEFKSLLFRENRSLKDKTYLALWLVVSAWVGFHLPWASGSSLARRALSPGIFLLKRPFFWE